MTSTILTNGTIGATMGNASIMADPTQPAWLYVVVTLMPFVLSALKSVFGRKEN